MTAWNKKDLSGKKYNKLTLLHESGKVSSSGETIWMVQCECGTVKEMNGYKITSGRSKSCGCSRRTDYTGKQFGQLTFIRDTGKSNDYGDPVWELQCDCGKVIFKSIGHILRGAVKSCGCLIGKQGLDNRKYDPIISSARNVWGQRYNDAGLSFDDFWILSQKPCFYCGESFSNVTNVANKTSSDKQRTDGNFKYNGLDRIDNGLGHSIDNVVPCCKRCNQAKNNMTLEEFLSLIKRIYEHRVKSSI